MTAIKDMNLFEYPAFTTCPPFERNLVAIAMIVWSPLLCGGKSGRREVYTIVNMPVIQTAAKRPDRTRSSVF